MSNSLELKEHYLKELLKQNCHKKKLGHKAKTNVPSANPVDKTNLQKHAAQELSRKSKNPVEVVVFKSSKKKVTEAPANVVTSVPDNLGFKTSDLLNKLQFDVTSFGLQGFDKETKRKFEQERAIKLGAKPKKREYVNYKVLMEERKQKATEARNGDQEPSTKKRKRQNKARADTVFWKDTSKLKGLGQVGRFKDGILRISGRDIKKKP